EEKFPFCLIFQHNTQLNQSYCILVETNFINTSIKTKPVILHVSSCITNCIMTEFEKLRQKYQVTLRNAKVLRCERF
ncbi:hypothetical protein HPG69_014328, partial [Diceros bicornis minor]